MSASPAGQGPNGTPTPNSGAPAPLKRLPPRKKTDPFAVDDKKKKLLAARPAPLAPKPKAPALPNGLRPLNQSTGFVPRPLVKVDHLGRPIEGIGSGPIPATREFTTKPVPGQYSDYPIKTTKREIRDALRYHIARFASNKKIDPSDQNQFIRPVSLHRRDPRQPPPGKKDVDTTMTEDDGLDNKERERLEALRLEKEAQRAADMAQIAPSGTVAVKKERQAFRNEKTTQIHRTAQTAEEMKEADLRYEEALPWHLEDADNKQTWVGTYEAALSNANVVFYIDGPCFRMVPIEKWYKFTPKNQFKTLTLEEAETEMTKKSRGSRWAMREAETKKEEQEREEGRRAMQGRLFAVKGERILPKSEQRDQNDDLDMNEDDLFQDDDEMPTMEAANDEESKFTAEKIKREQLGANLFGEGDANEVDAEIAEMERERERDRKLKKRTEKALKRREKNYNFATDSDSDPYAAESDSDTSDEEKQLAEDLRKDELAKAAEREKLLAASSQSQSRPNGQPPSGSSTKGSNTPLGRPPKLTHNHLKRAGSPHLSASETSGNESARKKHKKKHHGSSSQPMSGSATPRGISPSSSAPVGTSNPSPLTSPSGSFSAASGSTAPSDFLTGSGPGLAARPGSLSGSLPGSRPGSLPGSRRGSSIVKLSVNGSKLSAIAGQNATSDTEMSDAGARKSSKIKLRLGSSAAGSRTGTPSGSRAQSPVSAPMTYTAEEIKAAIPAKGVTIQDLLKVFAPKLKQGGKDLEDRKRFIDAVKANSWLDGATKLLFPKRG